MGAREDAARDELVAKIQALAQRHQTTPRGLFALYDADGSGALTRQELAELLTDAEVGNGFTRGAYVSAIFSRLDLDRDATLTLAELDAVIRDGTPPPPPSSSPPRPSSPSSPTPRPRSPSSSTPRPRSSSSTTPRLSSGFAGFLLALFVWRLLDG